jgi:hypothetical protein
MLINSSITGSISFALFFHVHASTGNSVYTFSSLALSSNPSTLPAAKLAGPDGIVAATGTLVLLSTPLMLPAAELAGPDGVVMVTGTLGVELVHHFLFATHNKSIALPAFCFLSSSRVALCTMLASKYLGSARSIAVPINAKSCPAHSKHCHKVQRSQVTLHWITNCMSGKSKP